MKVCPASDFIFSLTTQKLKIKFLIHFWSSIKCQWQKHFQFEGKTINLKSYCP